jgi:flagellar biosynthesis protein FlhB
VAIKYDQKEMSAPKVLAKGQRLIAEKIKKIAGENNVPVVEDKPIAQWLFKSVDIGAEIPMELYQAVAEILAMIYRLGRKAREMSVS